MTANQQQIKLELSPVPSVKSTEKANIILIRNPKLLKTLDQDEKPILFQLRPQPIQTKTATQTNNTIPALSTSLNGVFNHKTLASLILNASNNCLDSRDASWLIKSICNKNSIAVINDSILKTSLVAQPHLMRNLTLMVDKQSTVGTNAKKEEAVAISRDGNDVNVKIGKPIFSQTKTTTTTSATATTIPNQRISIINSGNNLNNIAITKNNGNQSRNNFKNNNNNIKNNCNKGHSSLNNTSSKKSGENSNNNNSDTKNYNENNTIINNIDIINKTNNNENNTKSKNVKSNNNIDKRSDKVIKPHTSTRTIEATNMVPSVKYSSNIPLSAGE